MLTYILAVLVGTGSVGLYVAAFFFPEIHRKHDFIWSGVGLFYALSLWIYARQTTGGILVGQTASVALLGWFVWQTLQLRRQLVPIDRQTPIPTTTELKQQLGLKQSGIKSAKPTTKPPTRSKATPPVPATPPAPPIDRPTVVPPRDPVQVETPVKQVPQSPVATIEEEEAWIKLEVKPSQPAAKPLGNPVRPPVVPELPAIAAESVPRRSPADSIEKTD